jgi:uncharacterized membrane protein (UPF0127 family)
MKAINLSKNQILADYLECAVTVISRMRGLLGKASMPRGSGLLIKPCKGIHTFGMKFDIDVLFLDRDNKVVAIRKKISRNRMTRIYFSAYSVLELPTGTIDMTFTHIGDLIKIS